VMWFQSVFVSVSCITNRPSYRPTLLKWCVLPSSVGTSLVPVLQTGQNVTSQSLPLALPAAIWW
jgi:hypothetical protein